jgi:hypothetical protein
MERSLHDMHRHRQTGWAPSSACHARAHAPASSAEQQFIAMERKFGATGGMVRGDDLASLMHGQCEQPVSVVARWIVERHVVNFTWRCETLLPLFQLEPHSLALRPSVVHTIQELRDVFDDWEMALWFAEPNTWLRGAAPVDLIRDHETAVLGAARADRFVARG